MSRPWAPLAPLIRATAYDAEKQELDITFAVGEYRYKGVPAAKVAALQEQIDLNPFSTQVFDATIEGKYPSVRLTS